MFLAAGDSSLLTRRFTMLTDQLAATVRHHWWLFLLRGLAAIAFGVLVVMWPGATVVALTAFIAAYALVDGIVVLASAFRMRAFFDRWWVLLVQGLISVAFGVLAFMNPALSLLYVVIMVAAWMVFASIAFFMLGQAQKAMGGSALLPTLGSIATLALAVLAVARPGATIAGVIALIAWFSLAIGIVNVVVAFQVRSLVKAVAPASA
jgi:uncharacterized membrane protein HdeD (DUF308 family)